MTNTDNKAATAVNSFEEFEAVCAICCDTNEAVPVTVSEHDIVIISKEDFSRMEFELFKARLESDVFHSSLQAERGEVISADDFFKKMQEKYGYKV